MTRARERVADSARIRRGERQMFHDAERNALLVLLVLLFRHDVFECAIGPRAGRGC
jgi:hypothetical protein